jgi:CubicO group peptidase (beta-lactamase class C family)
MNPSPVPWRISQRAWRTLGAALVVTTAACGGEAKRPVPTADPLPGAEVDALFAEFAVDGSPGATVMVIRDGQVLHSAGYGTANLTDGSPLQPSTPVRLGSVSKAFTAMAIVILEERGELSFDAPVTEWVPELSRFPGVTVRHLLNHTSGLPDYYDSGILMETATAEGRETPLQNAEAMTVYESWGEPVFPPGERYEYSNPGYEALALIVERVSGQTFARFLDAEIFTPLGMSTAVVRDLPGTVIPGRAIGYSPGEEGAGWEENDDHWGNWLVGAGGVYASLDDLYQWDQALWEWAETGTRTAQAFLPATLNDGSQSLYGFGWSVADRLGRPAIHHTGGWVGFITALVRLPEERLTVIVLSNASANSSALADATAAVFLDDPALDVRLREIAFARTMADRDLEAFLTFVSPEAIFFNGNEPLRGRDAVGAAWAPYFEGPSAPFSWRPDLVHVLDSGDLALSSGPVRGPDGTVAGRFNSIWRLDADGVWRVVFDKGS